MHLSQTAPAPVSPFPSLPCACHEEDAGGHEDHAALLDSILTQLPGNVPINEHIERLLHGHNPFVICYFDLGHIGGDDLVILFQSADWEQRCRQILARFDQEAGVLFDAQDLKARGFNGEDRRGNVLFFPLTSLSVGAVPVAPDEYRSHYEVAAAAGEAKKQAKILSGSALFIERRRPDAAKLHPPVFSMASTGEIN